MCNKSSGLHLEGGMCVHLRGGQRGQTLIELIVVVAVSVIVVGALVFAIISSLRNAQFAKNQTQATKLAQEGIEKIRAGRDRNQSIQGWSSGTTVTSWNGNDSNNTLCAGTTDIKSDAFWCYQISVNCGSGGTACYFKLSSASGALNYSGSYSTFPPSIGAEDIYADGRFIRAIILSDDDTYKFQKKVTVIVRWSDFSGPHESKLMTILRKL